MKNQAKQPEDDESPTHTDEEDSDSSSDELPNESSRASKEMVCPHDARVRPAKQMCYSCYKTQNAASRVGRDGYKVYAIRNKTN